MADKDAAEAAVRTLLRWIGEDPTRDGLIKTPHRVAKAWIEMTQGYDADIAAILSTSFDVPYDEMVVLRDVPFASVCEHHMLPFTGHVTIGYVPTSRVVGLSKLARLVDAFAQRLQVQERLTNQLTEAMQEHLAPLGCGAVVRGNHSCMCNRGIKKAGTMVTSSLVGVMRTDPVVRAEFLALAHP
jgi:GTP cyclohydrolase I